MPEQDQHAKDAKAADPALAAALRENLLKRKTQSQGRSGSVERTTGERSQLPNVKE